jgi:hypothetical protein
MVLLRLTLGGEGIAMILSARMERRMIEKFMEFKELL